METLEKYEDVFLNSLLIGNRTACETAMKEFRKSNSSIIDLYEEIFKKSLYKIGEQWEYNKIKRCGRAYGDVYYRRFNEPIVSRSNESRRERIKKR